MLKEKMNVKEFAQELPNLWCQKSDFVLCILAKFAPWNVSETPHVRSLAFLEHNVGLSYW